MPQFSQNLAFLTLLVAFSAHGAYIEHTGRGIYHFTSQSGCPFDNTTEKSCNRIALDTSDARVKIDISTHTIIFSSDDNHHTNNIVGDVLLHGTGIDSSGRRVPLSAHLLLRRDQDDWNRDIYIHTPVAGKFTDVNFDPYQIRVKGKDGERDILTPDETLALFTHPSWVARAARHFINVRATNTKQPSEDDITIALGIGKLAKSVARARLLSSTQLSPDINRALTVGSWSIRFDALSNHIPTWVAPRQLFLFGLENSRLVSEIRAHGFKKNDWIEFGSRNGSGYLIVNGNEEPLPRANASAKAFLQESFMGLILGWHHDQRQGTGAKVSIQTSHRLPT